ncbi:MAG: nitroreductase family protein [Lachnospiraceae bacterium]|jgi:nitroreductase
MELFEAIAGRRSIRKYKDTPIAEDDIRDIINAGCMAPSGTNIQPWYYVAISNPEALRELREIAAKGAQGFLPKLAERFKEHPEVIKTTMSFVSNMGNAPLVILAFLRINDAAGRRDTMIQSVAAGIQNMMLAAYSKGIGSCWMTALVTGGVGPLVKERFAPDRGDLVATITFGYPDQEVKAPKRKDDRYEIII